MKNKTELSSIALFSVLLTIFGVYVDGDVKDPSTLKNTGEFMMMLVLAFALLSIIYYSAKFIFKKTKQLFA